MGENRICCNVDDFAKSEFQMFEPNFKIGAVNKRTIKLLQTLSLHYLQPQNHTLYLKIVSHSFKIQRRLFHRISFSGYNKILCERNKRLWE